MVYAVIYFDNGIVIGVAEIPTDQLATYHPGEGMQMEIINSIDDVPLLKLSTGKVIMRVGPKQYEIQDAS